MPPASAVIVVENPVDFAARAAGWIAQALREVAASCAQVSLGLAGGSTPAPVYRRLAEERSVPWQRVALFFGDERAVPPADPRSNYRLALESLVSRLAAPPAALHRMEAEREDREQAARDYAALLPDPLDVLLLGMGSDGHVASLFPGSSALAETARRVVPVFGGDPAMPRLTITPPVIRSALQVLVMVAGANKADAVARALEGLVDPRAVPAQLAQGATWILDRSAAAALGGVRG